MAIPISCGCGFTSSVKDSFSGKTVKCPACATRIHIPLNTELADVKTRDSLEEPYQKLPGKRPFYKDPVVVIGAAVPLIVLAVFAFYLESKRADQRFLEAIAARNAEAEALDAKGDVIAAHESYDQLVNFAGERVLTDDDSSMTVETARRHRDRLAPAASAAREKRVMAERAKELREANLRDRLAAEEHIRQVSIAAAKLSASEVLDHYFRGLTLGEKEPYLLSAPRAIPLMRRHLDVEPFGEHCNILSSVDVTASSICPLPYTAFRVVRKSGATQIYYVVKTRDGHKVDWEALDLEGTPLKLFMVEPVKAPVKFRVMCELSTYYNYDFADTERSYYSFKLEDRFGTQIHGYMKRDTPRAREYVEAMSHGNGFRVIVELHQMGPFGARGSERRDQVIITRFVSPAWTDFEE